MCNSKVTRNLPLLIWFASIFYFLAIYGFDNAGMAKYFLESSKKGIAR
jgi:hypothetical protein